MLKRNKTKIKKEEIKQQVSSEIKPTNNPKSTDNINYLGNILSDLSNSFSEAAKVRENLSNEDIEKCQLIHPLDYTAAMMQDCSGTTYNTLKHIPMEYDIKFNNNYGMDAVKESKPPMYSYIFLDSNSDGCTSDIIDSVGYIFNQICSGAKYQDIASTSQYKFLCGTKTNNREVFFNRMDLLYNKWRTSLIGAITDQLLEINNNDDEHLLYISVTKAAKECSQEIFNTTGLNMVYNPLNDIILKLEYNNSSDINILFEKIDEDKENDENYTRSFSSLASSIKLFIVSSCNATVANLYNKVFNTIFKVYSTALTQEEINKVMSCVENIFILYHDYLYDLCYLTLAEYALYYKNINNEVLSTLINGIDHHYHNDYNDII